MERGSRRIRPHLVTAALLVAATIPATAAATDHFTCYRATATSGSSAFTARDVTLTDRYRSSSVRVVKPRLLCAPASKNGEDPSAPSHPDHLEDYQAKAAARFVARTAQTLVDQFGSHTVDVKKPISLQVPTAKSRSATPPPPAIPAVGHFQCYKVKRPRGTPKFARVPGVGVEDQFGAMTVELLRLQRVCVPADKNGEEPGAESRPDHLICYRARQTGGARFASQSPLYLANQFGAETVAARKLRELCVPALQAPVGTPTSAITPSPAPTASNVTATQAIATSTATAGGATATSGATPVPTATSTPSPRVLRVGAATRSLNPNLAVAPPDGQVFLGGFGLGAVRRSTGILEIGAQARAFVVDNGDAAIAFVENDNQGMFAAYELMRGPVGTVDIAKAVEALRPALRADHIVIAADHSHAGQDLVGVWGGVPNEYLNFVKQQITAAIVEAYDTREVANLAVGAIGGIVAGDDTSILNSQFDDSSCTTAPTAEDPGHTTEPCTEEGDFPDWDLVDQSVRVLHATRPADGSTIATLVNFAAHSTVMGSGNTLVSADWPGPTGEKIEAALGGTAVVMPAANGRTQPDRPGGPEAEKLDTYATSIAAIALQAVANAVPVVGDEVGAKKRLILEPADNAGILALNYAGQAGCLADPQVCVPVMRAQTPPWSTGNVIGTIVSALRVGNVLFSGAPGEPYPQIAFGIQRAVDAGEAGVGDITHHFIFSLCDDQLGYLIAPAEGVPAAAEKTAIDGNDNFLFNVAAPIGDHVMCTATDLALDIGFAGDPLTDPRCALWTAEADLNPVTLLPNGAATPVPSGAPTPQPTATIMAGAEGPPPSGTWLAGDLHVHTIYSHDVCDPAHPESEQCMSEPNTAGFTPAQQLASAELRGLGFVALTDHNTTAHHSDPGVTGYTGPLLLLPGQEMSLQGHAGVWGYSGDVQNRRGSSTAAEVEAIIAEVHLGGGLFSINHPQETRWRYGRDPGFDDVTGVDAIEIWNISWAYQSRFLPFLQPSDNPDALLYYGSQLDRGVHVPGVGGSDSHWIALSDIQGVGQPSTWVFVTEQTPTGVLDGIRAGRVFVASEPPAFGGARLFLEGDADADGVYGTIGGGTLPASAPQHVRVRIENGTGNTLRLVTNGGAVLATAPVLLPSQTDDFTFQLPAGSWIRADLYAGDPDTAMTAIASPLYVE